MKSKRIILLTILIFTSTVICFAQKRQNISISSDVEILVTNIETATEKIEDFIKTYDLTPSTYEKKQKALEIVLFINHKAFEDLNNLIQKLGYIQYQTTNATDYTEEILIIEREIELLEKELSSYQSLVKHVDSSSNDRYFKYWEKIIEIEKAISEQKMAKSDILNKMNNHRFKLSIIEEVNAAETYYSSSWVNMPGIEYSFLKTEQPEQGISPESMSGISLKYLFNTGKSYGVLGLYRSNDADSVSEIDETYIFAFGQDFYSKYMGRGQRKFFNLYTSFNVGFYISTSQSQKITSWFVNPYLGLELFKNKYILVDNKVGYFMPYRNNRTQRGLLYNVSFNFVF